MGLQYSEIADAVIATQELLIKKGAFTDLQTDLQDHVLVRNLWKGRNKDAFPGGDPWQFQAQIDHNHSASVVELYEDDGGAIVDTLIEGEVNARHVNAFYHYENHEKSFQKGGHAIVNLVKTRYIGMIISMWELMETLLWSLPSNDGKTPFGIAYWVTRNASEGFNGGNPSGFSAGKAGIDQATYSRWANWTSQYVSVTKQDLIRRMRTAHRKIRFRSPISHENPSFGMGNGIFTNSDVIGLMEELLEDQNMNLGNDLASKDGQAMFKSTPVLYAPYLDNDSQNPVYMLDFKWLTLGFLKDWEYNLSKPYMVPNKHNVNRVDLDVSCNMICTDLRRQAVINTA